MSAGNRPSSVSLGSWERKVVTNLSASALRMGDSFTAADCSSGAICWAKKSCGHREEGRAQRKGSDEGFVHCH